MELKLKIFIVTVLMALLALKPYIFMFRQTSGGIMVELFINLILILVLCLYYNVITSNKSYFTGPTAFFVAMVFFPLYLKASEMYAFKIIDIIGRTIKGR